MMSAEPSAADKLRSRTKEFALQIIRFCSRLPRTPETGILGKQLLRSGTSVGANYREACRARSSAEFISKVEIVLQELDETAYWIELLIEGYGVQDIAGELLEETDQLTSIFVASVKTVKARRETI
jgi:four helix bundle protein